MYGTQIKEVCIHKHLGITFAHDLRWSTHIEYITNKAWKRIKIMKKIKYQLDRKSIEVIYQSFIKPNLEYADVLFYNCTQSDKKDLKQIQHEAARIIFGTTKLVSIDKPMNKNGWESLGMETK
jgi:hypothetical protein